jgi:hypothetical protein
VGPSAEAEQGGHHVEDVEEEEGPPMKALTVIPLTAGSAELSDIGDPPEADGPVLVETLG